MVTELTAGRYTVRGLSVGGVYTSLQIPELDVILDAGIPLRSFAGTDRIFLSHGHPDHASGLASLLGIRMLIGKGAARVYLPAQIVPAMEESIGALSRLHRTKLLAELIAMHPGDVLPLGHDLWVQAFATHHGVASLGYQFVRRVTKLRPELRELPGEEIARLRRSGAPNVFEVLERRELAYATDTLSRVLETEPSILEAKVLILECTFIDDRRTVEEVRERMHIHLDELIANAGRFHNEQVVLMHFSQAYSPEQVHQTLRERLPPELKQRVRVFAPEQGRWFG